MNKTLLDISICLLISLLFRVAIPFDTVMTNPVQFNTQDAYYWLRVADQYPNISQWDYFINYPIGIHTTPIPLWSSMIAVFAHIFGITVSQAGAILPAILGVLTIIPVYVICRLLFKNRWVAFVSCLILAILPGEFMSRTQLGAADHHVLEIFVFSLIMMFVIMIIKYGKLTDKESIGNTLTLVGFTILFVVLYMKTWGGWLLIHFIISIFGCLWLIIKLPKLEQKILVPTIVLIIGVLFYAIVPEATNYLNRFLTMVSWDLNNTIGEEMPLLFTTGKFDMAALWGNFSITFFLALVGLGILGYRYFKKRDSCDLLFIVWTLIIIMITLTMRRFAYYLSINIAILTGYFCYIVVSYAIAKLKDKDRVFKIGMIVAWLVILISVPLIQTSISVVTNKSNTMSSGWVKSLQLLKSINNQDNYIKGYGTDYCVLSWWDYGYWIVREAHMPVLCSPGQGNRILAAKIFTSADDDWIKEQLKENQVRYIILSDEMINEKRYAINEYSGVKPIEKGTTYITSSWGAIWDMYDNYFMDRLYQNKVDYCQLVIQSDEVKVFEVQY